MGCGGSRLDPGEQVPARILPLLRCRFEEMKRRRNLGIQGESVNLSKKELLKYGVSCDDYSSQRQPLHEDDQRKSSSHDNEKVAPAPDSDETTITVTTTTTGIKVVKTVEGPLPNCPNVETPAGFNLSQAVKEESQKPKPGSPKVTAGIDCKEESTEQVIKNGEKTGDDIEVELIETDGHEQGEDTEEDEEGSHIRSKKESYICPGSPSFRVYYLESLDNIKDDAEDDDMDKKSASYQDSDEMAKSLDPLEVPEGKKKKGGRRGSRFRKVIPKGSPSVVRNLRNVKSRYYPSCSSHQKAHVLKMESLDYA